MPLFSFFIHLSYKENLKQHSMERLAKYIIIAGITALIGFIAWYFRSVLIYIGIAAVISIIGKPMVGWMTHLKIKKLQMPRWLATVITLVFIVCVCLSIFLLLSPIVGEFAILINNLDYSNLGSQANSSLADVNRFLTEKIPTLDDDFRIEVHIFEYLRNLVSLTTFTGIIASFTGFIVDFGIAIFSIIFISFFLILNEGSITKGITYFFSDKYTDKIIKSGASINHLLSRYFVGIFLESVCIAILNSCGLIFIVKMDPGLAIVVGVASGILNIVPYVGPLIGDIMALVMGLLVYINEGISMSLLIYLGIILAIFVVTQFIDNYVFQPIIYSNSVKAHPLEIFIVILLAGQIGGIFGILIAIPAYTVIRAIAREFLSDVKIVRKLTDNM